MKKLALGLILAALSSGVFAQGAEVAGATNVAVGGRAAGAGGGIPASAALITAGVVTADRVATGANAEIRTSY